MFEQLTTAIHPPDRFRRADPMPGVAVWDLNCAYAGRLPAVLERGRFETLLCLEGAVRVDMENGRRVETRAREILLLSDVSHIREARLSGKRFRALLVAVDGAAARESLARICALLGNLTLDVKQVGALMAGHGGCAAIRATAWSDAMFAAVQSLPEGERERYSALKAVELLYLLCRDSPLLPAPPVPGCRDRYQAGVVEQVRDHMMDHLGEPLTIEGLARRHHLSPTMLKVCFRQLYGQPIHQYLLACRMERAAELLASTSQSVVQIALSVGYRSISQFGVAFKARYRMTPAQYRRMMGNKKI